MRLIGDVLNIFRKEPPKSKPQDTTESRSADKPMKHISWDKPASIYEFFERMVSSWGHDTEVTQDNLLSLDAWWRGVRIISDSISGLPVNIYQRTKDGRIEERRDHPLYHIMNVEASPAQGHFTWKSSAIDSTLNTGDSFSYIIRDKVGRIKHLVPIWPGAVYEWMVDSKYELYWKIQDVDGWVSDRDIFHLMGFTLNGITGLNPVEVHRENLSAARGATMYADKLMKNGAFLGGVIETVQPISENAREKLENSWQSAYGGAINAGKVPILDKGMTYKPIALSPEDVEWLGMRKDLVSVISRILGVPMHMLSELGDATYSNIEHQSQEFERYSLRPWIERMESEILRKGFTEKEINEGYYVAFDTNPILRGNLEDQAQYYQTMFNIGVMNQDEIRARMNLGPINKGDRYYIQGNNMIPTDRIDEVLDSNIKNKALSSEMRKMTRDESDANKQST